MTSTGHGPKYDAALEWGGVLVVNHTWLEDVMVRSSCPCPTQLRYLPVVSDAKSMNRIVGRVPALPPSYTKIGHAVDDTEMTDIIP